MSIVTAKWSLQDYHQMIQAGILENRKVELLKGEIIEMSPEGAPHSFYAGEAGEYLRQLLGNRAKIREAHPIFKKSIHQDVNMLLKASGYLHHLVILSFGAISCLPGIAVTPAKMGGIWYEERGVNTVISVVEKDGFIDITGKDDATIYSCTGILEKNKIACFGNGINHQIDRRFMYKSQLELKNNGQTIAETWEAVFANGEKLTGSTVFQRQRKVNK
jgi:hypothetical protein